MVIDASKFDYKELNKEIRNLNKDVTLVNCLGHRFIGNGLSDIKIDINGVPGNALGAYLNGASITVNGNAQDAVGDTMNEGRIVIHGNTGDAVAYAMRGGEIFVKGNAGYRAGIHMKSYEDKLPVLVVGGVCGSFLGEYLAGGLIIVLGLDAKGPIVGNFCGTGMHGGKMFLRGDLSKISFPKQVKVMLATDEDLCEIEKHLRVYSDIFGVDLSYIYREKFYVLTPNTSNPYKKLYVEN